MTPADTTQAILRNLVQQLGGLLALTPAPDLPPALTRAVLEHWQKRLVQALALLHQS